MSRIGKNPIVVPAGVTVEVTEGLVTVKGKLGQLTQEFSDVTVKLEEGQVIVERSSDHKDHRAKHGLYRSLVSNMLKGVSTGYKITQELVGVGYRATAKADQLELLLGYSHNIIMVIPSEVKVTTTAEKGQNPTIILESHDHQLIGQVAAKIRSLRKPEPYKGKGIKFAGEVLRRKAGKSASKK